MNKEQLSSDVIGAINQVNGLITVLSAHTKTENEETATKFVVDAIESLNDVKKKLGIVLAAT